MGNFFEIVMYILFAAGVIMSFSTWLSDIKLGEKKFKWYFYIPAAVVNTVLGVLAPHVFVWWLSQVSSGSGALAVLIITGYPLIILASELGMFFVFFRKRHFSALFYWSISLTCLFGLSFILWQFFGA